MKKIVAFIVGLFITLCVSAQTYSSNRVEVLDSNGVTIGRERCDYRFVLDTAAKVLTSTDMEYNKVQIVLLLHKSGYVLQSRYLRTWGYDKIKTTGTITAISFTSVILDGELFSINFYSSTGKILVFYIIKAERL